MDLFRNNGKSFKIKVLSISTLQISSLQYRNILFKSVRFWKHVWAPRGSFKRASLRLCVGCRKGITLVMTMEKSLKCSIDVLWAHPTGTASRWKKSLRFNYTLHTSARRCQRLCSAFVTWSLQCLDPSRGT